MRNQIQLFLVENNTSQRFVKINKSIIQNIVISFKKIEIFKKK